MPGLGRRVRSDLLAREADGSRGQAPGQCRPRPDCRQVIGPFLPPRLGRPYKLSLEPHGSPLFAWNPLMACRRYEPRKHLKMLAIARLEILPSPLRDKVGYFHHDRFRAWRSLVIRRMSALSGGAIVICRLCSSGYGRGKPVARPKLCAIALAVCVALDTTGALAADVKLANHRPLSPGYVPEPGSLTLVYDVEAIGIPVMTARVDISFRTTTYDMSDAYDISLVLRTVGLIDFFTNWNMSMNAQGILMNTAIIPEYYREVQRKRALEIVYAAGKIVSAPMTPPSVRNQREEVAEAARTDAADLLSLTLAALRPANEGRGCNYRGILYGGDQLYDLSVTPYAGSDAKLAPISGSTPPLVCVFEFQRRAYQKQQSDPGKVLHDHDPETYRVWLSQISANGPMVPIKLVFDLDIGVMRATLRQPH
jgi:hypothetical protein